MTDVSVPPRATPTSVRLLPDSSRVVAKLFVPGLEDVGATGSRANAVIDRLLELDEQDCRDALENVIDRFSARHHDVTGLFTRNADRVLTLIDVPGEFTPERKLLIGACFTHEYSIEAAALCNPSIVLDADPEEGDGSARFVMSVRGVGEGHR